MTISFGDIPDEVERRTADRRKGDLKGITSYTLPGTLRGRISTMADTVGVTRSALVTLLMEDAIADLEHEVATYWTKVGPDMEDDE